MKTKKIKIKSLYCLLKQYGNLGLKVNTPYGYKIIQGCEITAENSPVFETTLEDGLKIETSPDHLFKTKNGRFVKVINLKPGQVLQTKLGNKKIISQHLLPIKKDLFDILHVSDVHQYYTNNIVSHNSGQFEALVFCLFNKVPNNCTSLSKLINDQLPTNTKAFVQVKLLINGTQWTIKRSIIPNKDLANIKLEVFEQIDGKEIERHQESRPKTDTQVLRKLIGDESTFLTTVLCSQKDSVEFADNKNANRLDLIMRLLGISIYDQKLKLCDEQLKTYNTSYNSLKQQFDSLVSKSDLLREKQTKLTSNSTNSTNIKKTNKQISKTNKQIKTFQLKISRLNVIGNTKSLQDLEVEKKDYKQQLIEKQEILKQIKIEQKQLIDSWNKNEEIKGKLDVWKKDNNKYSKEKQKVSELNVEVRNLESQLESEICPTCGQKRHNIDREQIKTDIKTKKDLVKSLNKLIDDWEIKQEELFQQQKQINEYDNQIQLLDAKIELLSSKLETVITQIKVLQSNKSKLKKREKYEKELEIKLNKLDLEKQQLYSYELNSNTLKQEIKVIDSNIELYEKKLKEVYEAELQIKSLNLYKKGMHRTGIPSLVIQHYIPYINSQINDYINDLFDFNIVFELNDNNLDIFFSYSNLKENKRDVSQACGMESTIINLTIRAALNRISFLPKPSMLMLDEVFSFLDDINLEKIKQFLIRLKQQYQSVIVISHLQEIKDLAETHIQLEKNNGITSIIS